MPHFLAVDEKSVSSSGIAGQRTYDPQLGVERRSVTECCSQSDIDLYQECSDGEPSFLTVNSLRIVPKRLLVQYFLSIV
jgi:hypothetical protein